MAVPRSLVALQRALGREAEGAAGLLAKLLEDLLVRRLVGDEEGDRPILIEATINRIQAAADLSGRIEVRFGAEAPDPEAAAPAGRLASPEEVRQATRETLDSIDALAEPGKSGSTRAWAPVPRVPFAAAVKDLESRNPIGAHALVAAGRSVAEVYAPKREGGRVVYPYAWAAAQAATQEAAAEAQRILVSGLREGTPTPEVAQELAAQVGWPESYGRTVARTNYATSTTAGRFAEAAEVKRGGLRIGFRYVAIPDSDVRRGRRKDHLENHLALDGLIAAEDDPVWDRWSPPGGFNCRCSLEPVLGDEVPRRPAVVPYGARFAPGFGARPRRA